MYHTEFGRCLFEFGCIVPFGRVHISPSLCQKLLIVMLEYRAETQEANGSQALMLHQRVQSMVKAANNDEPPPSSVLCPMTPDSSPEWQQRPEPPPMPSQRQRLIAMIRHFPADRAEDYPPLPFLMLEDHDSKRFVLKPRYSFRQRPLLFEESISVSTTCCRSSINQQHDK
jgi:hypothetical protein